MLNEKIRKKLPWAILLVVVLAIFADFVLWWGSLGYPLHAIVCDPTTNQKNCPSYNVLFAFAMSWAYDLNYWGMLVTAIATGFIAWFTFSLRDATAEQGRLTEKSIELATTATNAAVAAERARFHIIIDRNNLRDFIKMAAMYNNSPAMPVSGDIRIEYHFKNYGKCPGRITEISHGIWRSETPPDNFVYTVVRQAPREYMVPSLGETEPQICESTQSVETMQDAIAIRTGRSIVWFFGRFDYVDFVTNKPQVHRFLLRYIQTESLEWRFQSYDYKHYNQST